MYSGILTLILLFTILHIVVSCAILHLSSSVQIIVQEISDCTRFFACSSFLQSGGSLLYSFDVVAMLLSMWVPHAAGIFQTKTNKGKVGLTFSILWTGIKITSDETKRPVSLPYNVFNRK